MRKQNQIKRAPGPREFLRQYRQRAAAARTLQPESGATFAFAVVLAAFALTVLAPACSLTSYASPEFARSSEEWAKLSDNRLEWDEIDGLVNEYNATVLNNRSSWNDDHGKKAAEIREDLLDAADELEELADELTSSSGQSMTAAGYRSQATQLRQQADDNVSDSESLRTQYKQIEAGIAQSVRENFIGYYQAQLEKKTNEDKLPYLRQLYQSAQTRYNVGTATQLDVLTAKENLETAEAALLTADSTISSYLKRMQVLCGWKYDATPEIGALPAYDMSTIASIDLAADTEKALSANLQLKVDERKLANATSAVLKTQYGQTVTTDREQIRSSVKSAYDSLVLAKTDYDTALSALSVKQENLQKCERQLAVGQISRMDYASAENDLKSAENDLKLKELAVFTKQTAYDSAVNGLASTGSSS